MIFIIGTNGHDAIPDRNGNTVVSDLNEWILGLGGNDGLAGLGGNDHLFGGNGDDFLHGGRGADYLDGGAHVDTVSYEGSAKGVYINLETGVADFGDAHGDVLVGIENVYGSELTDTLIGDGKANTLRGLTGDDSLTGRGGDDHLLGEEGHDILKGGGGADKLYGGAGFDTADYSDSWQGVYVDLKLGQAAGGTAQGDTFDSIENLNGSAYGDGLVGDDKPNRLMGLGGSDLLAGGKGIDILEGGSGDDRLEGGADADKLLGGPGYDVASYADSDAGVFVSLKDGLAYKGDAQGDTLVSIEHLIGSEHNDSLWADDGENHMEGLGGDDLLKGYGADDHIVAGEGDDHLYGMDGLDVLAGGDGKDILIGGSDRDILNGGEDADTFRWLSIDDTAIPQQDADEVTDFSPAEDDCLDLSAIDADIYAEGNQAFTFIGADAFTLNTATPENTDVMPGELRYYHAGGNTYIEMQTGDSPDVEGVIRIDGIVTPQASWFML